MKGDVASIRQNAIPSLAADFGGIEATVKSQRANLAASQATVKAAFLLNAMDASPNQHTEFYCGVFGGDGQLPDSAAFYQHSAMGGSPVVLLTQLHPEVEQCFWRCSNRSNRLESWGPVRKVHQVLQDTTATGSWLGRATTKRRGKSTTPGCTLSRAWT